MSVDESATWPRVPRDEVRSFVRRCMEAVGTRPEHAADLAELLVTADYRGHYSHGINRLEVYVGDMRSDTTTTDAEPTVLKETPATAWVDGNMLLGPVVGKFCMDLAIQKAKEVGIGWVSAKGSNHFGIAGWYGMRACQQGLVGMAFTNATPSLVPTRAKKAAFGTNPICVTAPGKDGDSFVLDMATSTVAMGKLEMAGRKGLSIPGGWGCDADGKETHDPKKVYEEGGGLLPLGGVEETGGYKGYGLAMMVELFCGILGGGAYGPNIRKWMTTDRPANLGHCFVAIDPGVFAPGFEGRLSDMLGICRGLAPVDDSKEVLIPGDPERAHMKKLDEFGGIPYHPNQIAHLDELAKELSVDPMKRL